MWFDRLAEGGAGDNKHGLRHCEHSMYVRRWQAVSGADDEDEAHAPTQEAQETGPQWEAFARKLFLFAVGTMIWLQEPDVNPDDHEQMAKLYSKYRDRILTFFAAE